ncbi:hypothetical protein [Streptomyces sp. NPDC001070]
MRNEAVSAGELGFLLGLVDPEQAVRARRRTGVPEEDPARVAQPPERIPWSPRWHDLPASVILWMLQEDDPRVNALVYYHANIDDRVRYDILNGLPYGPDPSRSVEVAAELSRFHPPELRRASGPEELTAALRAVTTMSTGRATALMVGRAEWSVVAAADREEPLPGYARWAPAVRPDCPPALRAQFGTHRKFSHRLRMAGVVDGPATYATATRPARDALRVLAMGRWAPDPCGGGAGGVAAPRPLGAGRRHGGVGGAGAAAADVRRHVAGSGHDGGGDRGRCRGGAGRGRTGPGRADRGGAGRRGTRWPVVSGLW